MHQIWKTLFSFFYSKNTLHKTPEIGAMNANNTVSVGVNLDEVCAFFMRNRIILNLFPLVLENRRRNEIILAIMLFRIFCKLSHITGKKIVMSFVNFFISHIQFIRTFLHKNSHCMMLQSSFITKTSPKSLETFKIFKTLTKKHNP